MQILKRVCEKIGLRKKEYPKFNFCLNCGIELSGKQMMFCSPKCCSYFHNVKKSNIQYVKGGKYG